MVNWWGRYVNNYECELVKLDRKFLAWILNCQCTLNLIISVFCGFLPWCHSGIQPKTLYLLVKHHLWTISSNCFWTLWREYLSRMELIIKMGDIKDKVI